MPFDTDEHFDKSLSIGHYMTEQTIPVPYSLPGIEREFYVCLAWPHPFIAQKVNLAATFMSRHWSDARHTAQQAADKLNSKMWVVAVDNSGREVYEFEPAVPGVENFKAPEPERRKIEGWGEF